LHLAGGYTAGEIVVEVKQSGSAPLVAGQMQSGLGVFKEDVGVCVGLIEIKEAEGEPILSGTRFRG
jgi:hypothetical protein